MEQTEVDFKELPYYKAIFKSFLTRQIQHLLEELSDETGEESIILTANINNGTLSQLGSNTGKGFLQGRDDIKTQFLAYCLKTNQPSPGKGAKQFQKRLNKSSGKAPASKRPRVDVPSGSSASQSTLPFPKLQKFVNNSPAQTKTPGQPSPPPLQPCPVSLYPALSQPFTVTSADGSQATNDITVNDLQNTGCDETDIKKESVEYAAMKAIGNELQLLQSYTDKSSDSNTFYSNQNVSTKDSYNEPNTDSEQNEENVQKSQNSNDPQEMNFGCMEIKTEPQDSGDETYAGSDNLSYMNDSQGLVGEDNSTSATESGTAPTSHYNWSQVTPAARGTDAQHRTDDPPTRTSKEKRPPLRLDLEQEEMVFEFVEAHQELYNKGHPAFLKTGHKLALWQQLADTLNTTDFDGPLYTPAERKPPKDRVVLSLSDKIKIIEEHEASPIPLSQRQMAIKYNVGRTCIGDIFRRKDFLLSKRNTSMNLSRKRFFSSSKFSMINKKLYEWYLEALSRGEHISGPILKDIGKQIANELQISDFNASNGWMEHFKKAFGVICTRGNTDVKHGKATSKLNISVAEAKNVEGSTMNEINVDSTTVDFTAITNFDANVNLSVARGTNEPRDSGRMDTETVINDVDYVVANALKDYTDSTKQ